MNVCSPHAPLHCIAQLQISFQGDPARQRRGKGQSEPRISMSKGRKDIMFRELFGPAKMYGAVGMEGNRGDQTGNTGYVRFLDKASIK